MQSYFSVTFQINLFNLCRNASGNAVQHIHSPFAEHIAKYRCLLASAALFDTHALHVHTSVVCPSARRSVYRSICLSALTAIRLCFCGFEIINSFCFPSLILVCIVLGHNSSRRCVLVLSLLCAVPSGFLSRCSCKPFYLASH